MSKTNLMIKEAEEFINQYRKGDTTLIPEAQKIMMPKYQGRDGLFKAKEVYPLTDLIANEVFAYMAIKESLLISKDKMTREAYPTEQLVNLDIAVSQRRDDIARKLLKYVELARANNVLIYPNLSAKAQKFDALEKEHEALKDKFARLQKYNNELVKENNKLTEDIKILHAFDKNPKGNDFSLGGLSKNDS